jgi:hypothetical protein
MHAFVLGVVEEAMEPLRRRLRELEERSLYMDVRIAAVTAHQPPRSRPETPPPAAPSSEEPTVIVSLPPLPELPAEFSGKASAADPRGRSWRKAMAVVVGCALGLGFGSLLGLASGCH